MQPLSYQWIKADQFRDVVPGLAQVLNACVNTGASVGFIDPFPMQQNLEFWSGVVGPGLAARSRHLLVAFQGAAVIGTVQLVCDTFPNQTHRADVSKLLVDPSHRNRGVARTLMTRLESKARQENRHLLTLDTITGGAAEFLYVSLGFEKAGEIPGYARAPQEDRLEPTLFMYKSLD